MSKYTAEYFIAKFEAIPAEKWVTGSRGWYAEREVRCVLGQCGETFVESNDEDGLVHVKTPMSLEYRRLVSQLVDLTGYAINDGTGDFFALGDSPKERVINALVLISTGIYKETL